MERLRVPPLLRQRARRHLPRRELHRVRRGQDALLRPECARQHRLSPAPALLQALLQSLLQALLLQALPASPRMQMPLRLPLRARLRLTASAD